MSQPRSIQPRTTRGQVCPIHSAPAAATPQQRFAQMFGRGLDQTSVQYRMVWSCPNQYTPLMVAHQPAQLQQHHILPASFRVNPAAIPAAQYISPVQRYDHSTAPRLLYSYNTLFRPISPAPYNPQPSRYPPLIRPIPIGLTAGHNISSSLPSSSSIHRSTRYIPPRFTPIYPGHYQRYQPQYLAHQKHPSFLPILHQPIQFPSPPFKINHSKSNHWNYRALITTNQSTNNGDKDDPPVTNIENNKTETISKDTQTIARGNVMKNTNTFDYSEASNSISVLIQPAESSNSKPMDFLTVNDKPPYSISAMIGMAIYASPRGQSTIRDIYNYISNVFPYYERNKRGWKNSVRNCLKKLGCFKQVSPTGGGVCWMIDTNSNVNFMKGSFKKPQKISNVTIKKRSIRKSNKSKHLTGDSLDSIWLLYAEDLNIRIIPNSTVEIYELVPPDSPLAKGAFETVI